MTRRAAVAGLLALATLAGCGDSVPPSSPSRPESKAILEATQAIIGACGRGPLTPDQERALTPRLQLLIDAAKEHPDRIIQLPERDSPLITTASLELTAVTGQLAGVGPLPVCSRTLATKGDRGIVDAGKQSLLADMPSARE